MKIAIKTFGCRLNQYEGEGIREGLKRHGHQIVDPANEPDMVIINGCAVTQRAEQKAFQFIRKQKRSFPESRILVTGCLGTLIKMEKTNYPWVDIVYPQNEKSFMAGVLEKEKPTIQQGVSAAWFDIQDFARHTRAFLKIQDGCDNRCSYCIVPFLRGCSYSRPVDNILKQAQILENNGFKEVVLTGVNIGDYKDKEYRLLSLLKLLLSQTDLPRIRLSSIELEGLDEDLIRLIADNQERIMPHIHVPLQSGSDRVLRLMNRSYNSADYSRIISLAQSVIPGLLVGTDVMVGFPGEVDDDFNRTRELIEELEIQHLHIFRYSPRPGVPSVKFSGEIDPGIKKDRSKILQELGQRNKKRFIKGLLGHDLKVLFEKEDGFGHWEGLSENYIKCFVKYKSTLHNKIVQVKAVGMSELKLKVEIERLT
ncbi:tRNA (N(6)-L-threonylcarbamoyladenosine(37)-C(2))-methylthiotransferase MtaB [bacterium]|nr:tRNA (N(6)-L-threonylcarbamoyladenosine(37)-C(2))-methylthiotransferase MtaB [bacterium]